MMCSPVRHNKLFEIQKSDNAPSALLCVAVGNQNTSRGKHRRSWAGASLWLRSVTLFPWCYRFILIVTLQKKDISISYIKMPLTFMSSLTQQPSGCSFTTSSSTSCPWRTSTTPSLPCMEKITLAWLKASAGRKVLKRSAFNYFATAVLTQQRWQEREKTELPSLVLNQLLVNWYPWSHKPSSVTATKDSHMHPGVCRKRRGHQLCISETCECCWHRWADSQKLHSEPTALPLSDLNKAFNLSLISFSWQHFKPLSCLVFLSFNSRSHVSTSLLLVVMDLLVGSNKMPPLKLFPDIFCRVPSFQNAYCNWQPLNSMHDLLSQLNTALQPHVELLVQPQERQQCQQAPSTYGALHRWLHNLRGVKIFLNSIKRHRGTVVKGRYKDLWRGNYSECSALSFIVP